MTTKALAAALIVAAGCAIPAAAQLGGPADSVAAHEFLNSCAACHGADGRGAGFLTRLYRGVDPGDLTLLAADNGGVFPLERVLEVIDGRADIAAHGDRRMPVWGDRYMGEAMSLWGPDPLNEMRVRDRVLALVLFLQSIQAPAPE